MVKYKDKKRKRNIKCRLNQPLKTTIIFSVKGIKVEFLIIAL